MNETYICIDANQGSNSSSVAVVAAVATVNYDSVTELMHTHYESK